MKKTIIRTIMSNKQTHYQDQALTDNAAWTLSSATIKNDLIIIAPGLYNGITQGDGVGNRTGDSINFRGIKLVLQLRPSYTSANQLCYKRYRLLTYATRIVNGALAFDPYTSDLLPVNYYDTYHLTRAVKQRAKNDFKILDDKYIQFRPCSAQQSVLQTIANDIAYGKTNLYQVDTYIKFPHRVVYTPGGGVNQAWGIYLRVYIDDNSQVTLGAVAPYDATLLYTYRVRYYWKDNE